MAVTADTSLKLLKIFEYLEIQKPYSFTVHITNDGTYMTAAEFGEEAPDSPMVGGASYGIGDTLDKALDMNVKEMRLD
jgi:hypothetical protein